MTFQEYVSTLGGRAFLYANASNGFKDVLVHLAGSSGTSHPNVVLPSYIPAKLYRAVLAAGCSAQFYEVQGKCTFDLNDIESLLDADTVAIFYVHYFGFPHQIEEICALAARHSIPLVEDCALTISATHNGKPLGTYGDVAIFSMRKMFMYSEGGFLRLGDRFHGFRPQYDRRVRSCFSLSKYLKQRTKYAYMRLTRGADPLGLVHADPKGYMDASPRQVLSVKMLSHFSELRLNYIDVDSVVRKRRENFTYIAGHFPPSTVFEPVYPSLPDGCTPYSFPLLVHDGKRDHYRRQLLQAGVASGAGWPEAPYDSSHQKAALLAQSMLEVPIHQALTRRQLTRSLHCLERFASHPAGE